MRAVMRKQFRPTTYMLGAVRIKDGLFLGDEFSDVEFQEMNKISLIVNCASKQIQNRNTKSMKFFSLPWIESDKQVLFENEEKDLFYSMIGFIRDGENSGLGILIHSVKGVNRAACALIAYLLVEYKWSLSTSMEFLNSRKPGIKIQASFLSQLEALEKSLQFDVTMPPATLQPSIDTIKINNISTISHIDCNALESEHQQDQEQQEKPEASSTPTQSPNGQNIMISNEKNVILSNTYMNSKTTISAQQAVKRKLLNVNLMKKESIKLKWNDTVPGGRLTEVFGIPGIKKNTTYKFNPINAFTSPQKGKPKQNNPTKSTNLSSSQLSNTTSISKDPNQNFDSITVPPTETSFKQYKSILKGSKKIFEKGSGKEVQDVLQIPQITNDPTSQQQQTNQTTLVLEQSTVNSLIALTPPKRFLENNPNKFETNIETLAESSAEIKLNSTCQTNTLPKIEGCISPTLNVSSHVINTVGSSAGQNNTNVIKNRLRTQRGPQPPSKLQSPNPKQIQSPPVPTIVTLTGLKNLPDAIEQFDGSIQSLNSNNRKNLKKPDSETDVSTSNSLGFQNFQPMGDAEDELIASNESPEKNYSSSSLSSVILATSTKKDMPMKLGEQKQPYLFLNPQISAGTTSIQVSQTLKPNQHFQSLRAGNIQTNNQNKNSISIHKSGLSSIATATSQQSGTPQNNQSSAVQVMPVMHINPSAIIPTVAISAAAATGSTLVPPAKAYLISSKTDSPKRQKANTSKISAQPIKYFTAVSGTGASGIMTLPVGTETSAQTTTASKVESPQISPLSSHSIEREDNLTQQINSRQIQPTPLSLNSRVRPSSLDNQNKFAQTHRKLSQMNPISSINRVSSPVAARKLYHRSSAASNHNTINNNTSNTNNTSNNTVSTSSNASINVSTSACDNLAVPLILNTTVAAQRNSMSFYTSPTSHSMHSPNKFDSISINNSNSINNSCSNSLLVGNTNSSSSVKSSQPQSLLQTTSTVRNSNSQMPGLLNQYEFLRTRRR